MEDGQLIAYLDRKFEDLRQEMNQRFEQVDQRFEQVDQRFVAVEGEVRGLHVLHEELSDRVKLVAEGVMGVDEKLEAFRTEMRKELRDVRDANRQSYVTLDRRLRKVESIVNQP